LELEQIAVGVGELAVVDSPHLLVAMALGSCVALVVYDARAKVGGLAHVMLPQSSGANVVQPGKYADTALEAMIVQLKEMGARKALLVAKLVGGAQMFNPNHEGPAIGERNVHTLTSLLRQRHVPIVAQEVGGTVARTVEFETATGACFVRTALTREPWRI
jgi:chemotaxis protein CheD